MRVLMQVVELSTQVEVDGTGEQTESYLAILTCTEPGSKLRTVELVMDGPRQYGLNDTVYVTFDAGKPS